MRIFKIAKAGKIMSQPSKKTNSGKMDSQIFVEKKDPQKKKEKSRTASISIASSKYNEGNIEWFRDNYSLERLVDLVKRLREPYLLSVIENEGVTKEDILDAMQTLSDVSSTLNNIE